MTQLGASESNFPKPETLKQYLERVITPPSRSYVKTIFKPGKFPQWSLICDHNFKVNVYEGTALFDTLEELYPTIEPQDLCLYVVIDNPEKRSWSLHVEESKLTRWEERDYGVFLFNNELARKRPRASKKTASPTEESSAIE